MPDARFTVSAKELELKVELIVAPAAMVTVLAAPTVMVPPTSAVAPMDRAEAPPLLRVIAVLIGPAPFKVMEPAPVCVMLPTQSTSALSVMALLPVASELVNEPCTRLIEVELATASTPDTALEAPLMVSEPELMVIAPVYEPAPLRVRAVPEFTCTGPVNAEPLSVRPNAPVAISVPTNAFEGHERVAVSVTVVVAPLTGPPTTKNEAAVKAPQNVLSVMVHEAKFRLPAPVSAPEVPVTARALAPLPSVRVAPVGTVKAAVTEKVEDAPPARMVNAEEEDTDEAEDTLRVWPLATVNEPLTEAPASTTAVLAVVVVNTMLPFSRRY